VLEGQGFEEALFEGFEEAFVAKILGELLLGPNEEAEAAGLQSLKVRMPLVLVFNGGIKEALVS